MICYDMIDYSKVSIEMDCSVRLLHVCGTKMSSSMVTLCAQLNSYSPGPDNYILIKTYEVEKGMRYLTRKLLGNQ
jgi:hypothetical protein